MVSWQVGKKLYGVGEQRFFLTVNIEQVFGMYAIDMFDRLQIAFSAPAIGKGFPVCVKTLLT